MKQNVLNFGKTWTNMTMLLALILGMGNVWAQTTLISPTGSGGMEIGGVPTGTPSTDFAANGWTVVNGANNRFFVGTAGTVSAGTYHAFTGPNASTWSGQAAASVSHIYQDVFVPAGESIISVSLRYKISVVDAGWDFLKVHLVPTSTVPVDGVQLATGQLGANIDGTTAYTTYTLGGAAPATGANMRVVISFRSDGVTPHGAAAVDEIHVTSAAPATFTATAQGGLWNSPATWVGGVVPPAANDIVIPAGSTVTANQILNYKDLTVNGNLNFTTLGLHTLTGNLEVGATGNMIFSPNTSLNQINIGGDFTNNGLVNAVTGVITFNGSGNSQLTGSGTFVGVGGRGIIRALLAVNNGTFTLNQTQDITITQQINHASNNFITNGKLRIDNAVSVFQNSVSHLLTTNMGSGYTTAPIVLGQTVSPWVANGTAVANTRYYSGNNVYLCTAGGTFDASAPVNTTPATETNGTATLLWVGNLGNLGNAFQVSAVTAGTQYYCGDNLYTCTVAGTPSAAAPPTHTSGTAVSGTATFAYVGSVAIASVNWDAVTETVRSLDLVTGGSGYQSIPTIVITNTGAGSGAAFTSVMFQSAGPANSLALKSTASVYTGSTDPRHSTAPVGAAGNGVYDVTTATYGWYNNPVDIGFRAPSINNLVTNQGSGYTSAPTVSISGGTTVGTGTALTFQVNVADGRVISVYCTGGTQAYSVPPTISLTGGGGTGATIDWGTSWPTATVNLSNGTSGYITSIDVTNSGFGYATAPVVALRPTVAGEVAATLPTCRLQQLNIQWGFFAPQTTNPNNNSIMALVPAHGRINALVISAGSQTFSSDIEVTALAPLPTFTGIIDMGGNNIRFSHPDYGGTAGTIGAFINNGNIELSLRGGTASATRTFPIGGGTGATPHFVHVTGAGAVTTGYTYTGVRVSRFSAPSGTVSPAGNITGIRGVRMDLVGSGSLTNLNAGRTVQMFWNGLDNLISNNPSIFIGQSTSTTGPWDVRSASTGTGVLPATGNRTTATTGVGPIAMSNTMYFAWVNNGFTPPPALEYNVVRTTGHTYNSIAPVALGGDGSGLSTTFSGGDDAISPIISLNVPDNAFTYQGNLVTGFRISTNGNIQLQTAAAATSSTAFTNSMADIAVRNVIAPFWDDLTSNPNSSAGAQNSTRYRIDGTAPNRTLIVEWSNYTVFGAAGPQLFFQIEMEEASGVIRINYGDIQLFNGTNDHRYSYSCGLNGSYNTGIPSSGQVLALTYENSNYWSHVQTQLANYGANGLLESPEPRSRYTFTPGPGYVLPAIPIVNAPTNDNVASAEPIAALSAFPTNISWNIQQNKSRIYTTRGATNSAEAICAGPSNAKDVWFSFVANEPNVTARIYASGGYIPRVQMLDASMNSIDCQVGVKGGQVDAVGTGLTIGATYYVRVYHDLTGTTAVFTAGTLVNGNVSGLSINDGGSNYVLAASGVPLGSRMNISGGGGNTFVGGVTALTGGAVSGGTFDGGNDYTSIPTIEVDSPDWGLTGQFAIVIYAPPVNDDCAGAIELINLTNSGCVAGENSIVGVSTTAATGSTEGLGSCVGGADDDLWYTFTATGTSTVVSVTGNLGFDPALQIWEGTDCGSKVVVSSPAGGCLNSTGINGTEEVTLTTVVGTKYYVRVYHVGAGFGGAGANFDICVLGGVPGCANLVAPSNLSTGASSATTLSWNAAVGATGYDVYFSTNAASVSSLNPSVLVSSNQAGLTFSPVGLVAGTTYHWIVIPRNSNGAATGCSNVFSFTTASDACTFLAYCVPTFDDNTLGDFINSVTLNAIPSGTLISNVTGANPSTYTLFSSPNPTMLRGYNYSISVQVGTYTQNDVKVWADWNANGIFEASEVIGETYNIGANAIATFNFAVPVNAALGGTRIRVIDADQGTTDMQPCTSQFYGEVEDYCITIVNPAMTQLGANSCNATNVALDKALFATLVGAPAYRFRIVGPNNANWVNNTVILDRPVRWFSFNPHVTGEIAGQTYTVEVAVGDGFGNFGPYGNACNVTLGALPTTQLTSNSCNTVNVLPSTALFANQVQEAQGYMFRIVGPNTGVPGWDGDTLLVPRPVRWFRFDQHVPGFIPGSTYEVRVAYLTNDGVTLSPFGPACSVSLFAPLEKPINSNNDIFVDNKTMNVVEFGANASHNPFTTDFGIQVLNANDVETINVSVYDMSGKLIERQEVNPMDIETVRFGMNLASGMYMIEVRQGANQAVIRQVKN